MVIRRANLAGSCHFGNRLSGNLGGAGAAVRASEASVVVCALPALVALTERDTARFLRKSIADQHPRSFRADHEMHIGAPRRVGVKSAEPEAEHRGRGVVAFVDRRAAATCKESANAGAGFPARQEFVPGNDNEFASVHASGCPEARPGMFSASPAMAVSDRPEKFSVDLVAYPPASA